MLNPITKDHIFLAEEALEYARSSGLNGTIGENIARVAYLKDAIPHIEQAIAMLERVRLAERRPVASRAAEPKRETA